MNKISELPQRILQQLLYFLSFVSFSKFSNEGQKEDVRTSVVVLSKSDRISELPKDILHRILYFLSQEDAVRTSLLSKSWHYNWSARPNLDFSDATFKGNKHEFISIVNNNLQRYCDQKLSLEEFRLSILVDDYSYHESVYWLLEKWIPLLTIMGVKKFCLSIRSHYGTSGRVKQLPSVVFGAESLQDLHVERFLLDQKAIQRMVPFNRLRVVRLERVPIEDEIFQQMISNCSLMIETMFLESCQGLRNIKVKDLCNLKSFSFYGFTFAEHELCRIEIPSLSLQTINICHGNVMFQKGADFRNLKDLYIYNVKSSWDHLSTCKFPSLKKLTLSDCYGLEGIKLFINAPNILYFTYFGDSIPSICFATTSSRRQSTSFIHLKYLPSNDASSWFFKLNEMVRSLSQSSIYLSIYEYSMNGEDIIQENIHLVQDTDGCADKPVVESLDLDCRLSSFLPSLLNHAFSICRPRIIGEYHRHKWKIEDIECMWNILMQRKRGDQDLEEVRMEINERNRVGWHPITLSELPSYQETEYNQVRFALKWREPSKVPRKSELVPGKSELEAKWVCCIVFFFLIIYFSVLCCLVLLSDSFVGMENF